MRNEDILFQRENSDSAALRLPATAVFISSLLFGPKVKQSPRDSWGNLKIPFLDSSIGFVEDQHSQWSTVDWGNYDVSSSLLGIPVDNIRDEGKTSFNFEASYFDLDCPVRISCRYLDVPGCKEFDASLSADRRVEVFGKIVRVSYNRYLESRSNSTNLHMLPRKFLFTFEQSEESFLTLCDMTTVHVEMRVSCVEAICDVTSIRNSTKANPQKA